MDLDTDARVDAAITFYEDCSKEKFDANEKRYKGLLNSPDLSEPQFPMLLLKHMIEEKVELGL